MLIEDANYYNNFIDWIALQFIITVFFCIHL